MSIAIRKALKHDMADILAMIQELADFEKMPNGPQLNLEDLYRDGGFSESNDERPTQSPLFFAFVAEENSSGTTTTVGYALCFNTYSTWQGKTLFMEDLYVRPAYRKLGIGKQLLTEVVKFSKQTNCSRCEFHVLDWNPASEFYSKMGAINLTATEGWHYYRLNRQAIDTICENNDGGQ